jgi:hypothetical protein
LPHNHHLPEKKHRRKGNIPLCFFHAKRKIREKTATFWENIASFWKKTATFSTKRLYECGQTPILD